VRGIRDNIQNNPPGFAVQPGFVAGVREAHKRGLHFELCLKHDQLGETIELVKMCPDGQFVLDHCAKPSIAAALREPWHTQMRELAALPNVVCKISGLITEADWAGWVPDEILWYARAAAEAFGHERIMYGSDWPVSEVAGGYMAWFTLAEALAANWSETDRERFFARNAERVYRLGN
jgi:L-fuconolactonase